MSREARYQFDLAYVEKLAAGDPDTEQHFTRYFGDLLSIKLRSRLRSPAAVDDVKQETFLRVLTALRQGKGIESPGALGAFVNAVSNNVLFELYRQQSRLAALDDENAVDLPANDESAEMRMESVEERAHVRQVLATLPPKEQQLLHWLFFEDMDKDEVCRRLNVDRNYLRVLLHRAKLRFRSEYVGG